jgi:hypothetical protein
MILNRKPKVPSEMEPYYQFLLKAVELAKQDIEEAQVGGRRFESAVAWLLYGQGYKFATSILSEPHSIRKHYEPIIDRRRDDSANRGNGCCPVSLS